MATIQPLAADAKYAAAVKNLDALKTQQRDVESQLTLSLAQGPARDVEQMVEGLEVLDREAARPVSSAASLAACQRRRADLSARRENIMEAIALQQNVIGKLRQQLSEKACAQADADYRAAVARIAKAAKELEAAVKDERAIVTQIEDAGYHVTTPIYPMPVPSDVAIGTPKNPSEDYSWAGRYIREAAAHRFIK